MAGEGVGDDVGEPLGYPIAGPTNGEDGRLKARESGDEAARVGVPGREPRYECTEARDAGRDGRFTGVRNRNGT